jgi:adenylate kinase
MARGDLVSDEIVLGLIQQSLEDIDDQKGYLLDGYPRNINQAKSLNSVLKSMNRPLEHTVLIDVDNEILVKRLSGRRTCSMTGKTLNIYFSPKAEIDECLNSGGELIQRDDDNIESISKRIDVYREQTEPMIEFYRVSGLLKVIDGQGSVEDVYQRLVSEIN